MRFTYGVWDRLCLAIAQHRKTIRVDQILDQEAGQGWLAIKHDVETDVPKALALAKIEAKYGIVATYYVQADLVDAHHRLLQEIQALGHEVSYHYDVLDANGGDRSQAVAEFDANLAKFRHYGFAVKSVCPHGNPVMIRHGWHSNKDFFRDPSIAQRYPDILDMVIALPTRLKESYRYISDAGYGFKQIVNIAENDRTQAQRDIPITDYEALLTHLMTPSPLILSTHPHRWERSAVRFVLRVYLFKVLRFTARLLSKIPLLKHLLSRYYYLAKKI